MKCQVEGCLKDITFKKFKEYEKHWTFIHVPILTKCSCSTCNDIIPTRSTQLKAISTIRRHYKTCHKEIYLITKVTDKPIINLAKFTLKFGKHFIDPGILLLESPSKSLGFIHEVFMSGNFLIENDPYFSAMKYNLI